MVIPLILSAAGSAVTYFTTKAAGEKETKEKLDLVKKLANLTPEQAQAVDALKEQDVEEMRTRAQLGIGPFKPLPEQASEQAKEQRAAMQTRQGAREKTVKAEVERTVASLTPEQKKRVEADPHAQRALISQVANRVVAAENGTAPATAVRAAPFRP